MKDFFLKLISATEPESSKRFISLCSFFLFVVIIVYSVFWNITIDSTIIYSLVSLILGSSVLTLVQNKS